MGCDGRTIANLGEHGLKLDCGRGFLAISAGSGRSGRNSVALARGRLSQHYQIIRDNLFGKCVGVFRKIVVYAVSRRTDAEIVRR
jgi:hypothetical protein